MLQKLTTGSTIQVLLVLISSSGLWPSLIEFYSNFMGGSSPSPRDPSGNFGILLSFGSTDEVTQDDLFDALEAQEEPAPPEVTHNWTYFMANLRFNPLNHPVQICGLQIDLGSCLKE